MIHSAPPSPSVMRRLRASAPLAGLALGLLAAALAPAARAQNDALRGTFVLNRAASDDVNAAINTTVARMNFVARPIARGRLRKTNPIHDRVVVAWTPAQIAVTTGEAVPVTSAPGVAGRWRREDGETFGLTQRWEGARLVQTFTAEDGTRTNTYTLGPDGRTLSLDVRITSPRLPRPLTYRLVYGKQG